MMRTYGVLSENGDLIYLYEKVEDIDLEEATLGSADAIIRIDSYTVLARGPSDKWERS